MNGAELANLYEMSYGAITRNLQDVTHEESLVHPEPGGNCLNWVLGHIVVYRSTMLKVLGQRPLFDDAAAALYRRGSHPDPSAEYLDLATLRGMFTDAHRELVPAVSGLNNEELSRTVSEEFNRAPLTGSIGDALLRLGFHESYHAGQIGLLRRIAGKDGAIK